VGSVLEGVAVVEREVGVLAHDQRAGTLRDAEDGGGVDGHAGERGVKAQAAAGGERGLEENDTRLGHVTFETGL
jgi:hypothetical protein